MILDWLVLKFSIPIDIFYLQKTADIITGVKEGEGVEDEVRDRDEAEVGDTVVSSHYHVGSVF